MMAGLCDTRRCTNGNAYSSRNNHVLCLFKASKYIVKRSSEGYR